MEVFEAYFQRADLDRDGRISGVEAVSFLQGSNLPRHVLAQVWMHADQNRTGFLGRAEFYNALRLVTVAQTGRELTQDIVKAALGPAAAKIPAPQINTASTPAPQLNSVAPPAPQLNSMAQPASQMTSAVTPTSTQNLGFRAPQVVPSAGMNQQFFPSPDNQFTRPPQAMPAAASLPMQGTSQGLPGVGNIAGAHPPNPNMSTVSVDSLGARPFGASMGVTSQVPNRGIPPPMTRDAFGLVPGPTPSLPPRPQSSSMQTSALPPRPQTPVLPSPQPAVKEPLAVSGNGFTSDPIFGGDVFSAIPTQPKQDASAPAVAASSIPNSSAIAPVATGFQSSVKQGQLDPLSTLATPTSRNQLPQAPPSQVKQNQLGTSALTAAGVSVGAVGSASNESQHPWPRITQSDIQKYNKVFVEVDKDRDGRITGEEARNLFLSWRLPREVLKQVWDLSDQDNDSMLTLREFCTALYFLERYREGRPLPAVLPNSVRFDETLLRATGQPTATYGGAWRPTPGLPPQGIPVARPVMPTSGLKPSARVPVPPQTDDVVQPMQPKSRVPVLEKHLVNQLSKDEQSSLNAKFQEATEADKKVEELEKDILDSKEKIEFYRVKMQELVLYKSRCDNRLNEITERSSADKREVESLAKKYEEKYKQVGDVASKLTIEQATFREIQERKMELYNAIVKMEQGGSADGVLQVRAERIQSDLEELVKTLNDRCKQYGLRAKPTTLVELPFGWQPGIQDGAADWDEDWDKFEDEGFVPVKELTVDVENIVAPPRTKPTWKDKTPDESFGVTSSSDVDGKMEKPTSTGEQVAESGQAYAHSEDGSARSPPESPSVKISHESPSQEFPAAQFEKNIGTDSSPTGKDSHSDHGGAESTFSGDKYADEPSWGARFDANDDTDSVWGFNPLKDSDHERSRQSSFFGSGELGLNPIRTESPTADSLSQKKSSFFADSVPSTPLFNTSFSPRFEGSDDHSFNSFARFDSFSTHDSGFFPPPETLARFDSIRSTRDSDHSRGFPSFDDSDPFGSTGPFKTSETPRRGSDRWSAF
ncbi:actin cytoskeleton-regulatory complex protein pan1-like [Magnolia sinica]|uniref:actin cytoskeleton-regulatory complex protein pan1-like n=1 Tax=Magnolia sinica TaxID=86752 RepID=UPI0026585A9A|nr:actin cytoskeleton-regulatory complex protein pan1-like [Magnolia sinica]XP_058098606.1 actin cytoskeleton-regulatory complex protein pan1-like [Magnolia sinica]